MKQVIKRIIAKEIIILFSSIVFIGLVWSILWLKNNYSINHLKKLKWETNLVTHKIDSLQATFSKKRSLEKILIPQNLPTTVSNALNLYIELMKVAGKPEYEPNINIRMLYIVLKNSKYPFKLSPYSKYDIPTYNDFYKHVSNEFSKDLREKQELKRIYDFLISKKYISLGFEGFTYNLQALKLPPKRDTMITFEKYIKQKEILNSELNIAKTKVISKNDLLETIKWIGVIILIVVYPLRYSILLLRWALKTLRQN